MTDIRVQSGHAVTAGASGHSDTALILSTVLVTFVGYLAVTMPLAILPLYVHTSLGFGAATAGFAVSLQYLATILSRAQVGQLSDRIGPKKTVIRGLVACGIGGLIMAAAPFVPGGAWGTLVPLLLSRLALGIGESLIGTGAIAWAIGRVGHNQTAKIIAWNGIATYGGLALGAPIGVALGANIGFASVGIAIITLSIAGFGLAAARPAVIPTTEPRLSARSVLGKVIAPGAVLALASTGFGTITTFVTLYFNDRGWSGAALCLSALGVGFIVARLLFANAINRFGGLPVARIVLVLQIVGLLLLGMAGSPILAILAAGVTGFGFSLVFPALGVVAVGRVPTASRGAALGIYSVFLDVGLGTAGPAAGWIAGAFGISTPFLLAALLTLVGLGTALVLRVNAARTA